MVRIAPSERSHWMRGGRLNQKRHIDMTEDEKENVASCPGQKAGHLCKNPVFRCTECGNYGCAQEVTEKCSEQGFKNDKCLNCGATGTRVPIMKDEFADFIAEWRKNDL